MNNALWIIAAIVMIWLGASGNEGWAMLLLAAVTMVAVAREETASKEKDTGQC